MSQAITAAQIPAIAERLPPFPRVVPELLDSPLKMLGQTGMPLALVALGMSLAEYDLKAEWKVSLAIVIPKLLILPLIWPSA